MDELDIIIHATHVCDAATHNVGRIFIYGQIRLEKWIPGISHDDSF